MAKKRKLNKIESHYAKDNPENLSDEDLLKELNCTKTALNAALKVKTKSTKTTKSTTKTRMDKLLAKNEKHGAVIMTEAAADYADKKRSKGKMGAKLTSAIHKPKG